MSEKTRVYFMGKSPVEISVGEFSGVFDKRKGYDVNPRFAHFLLTSRDDFTADKPAQAAQSKVRKTTKPVVKAKVEKAKSAAASDTPPNNTPKTETETGTGNGDAK